MRSQARLRQCLEEYFRTTGTFEPIRITIPKCSYVPLFEVNPESVPEDIKIPDALVPIVSPTADILPISSVKPAQSQS